MLEAEAFDGPSLVIAYAHCIAQGIDMSNGVAEQRKAVQSGYWMLYRFNPALIAEGKNPLQIDSGKATSSLADFMAGENRFRITKKAFPERYDELAAQADEQLKRRINVLNQIAQLDFKK
ncbi:hypothetical protein RsTz2092_13830 [Deferribacterales bacterium RsTz2092]|nr:hypothetical protein AGMMS49941_13320 [Deferribacterales bacterium]